MKDGIFRRNDDAPLVGVCLTNAKRQRSHNRRMAWLLGCGPIIEKTIALQNDVQTVHFEFF